MTSFAAVLGGAVNPPTSKPFPADEATPMVRQYLRIKAEYPEAILLFRIGDFYETFDDDAREASRILGIALTRKHVGNGRTLPLAGIPHHALESYLGRLVRAGRRVAICDQIEEARDAKGPTVRREVVRVVTPGTLLEDTLLEPAAPNFLAAVALHEGSWALAWCDLSTGGLSASAFGGDDPRRALRDELRRLAPAEILATAEELTLLGDLGRDESATLTRLDPGLARLDRARAALLEQLRVQNLEGFGAEEFPAAIRAAGALVGYLRETQRRVPGHIRGLELCRPEDHLVLDAATQRSLELTRNLVDGGRRATLLDVLDHTATPMGGRLLRQWILKPLRDLERILERQEAIADFMASAAARDQLRTGLRGVRDLERLVGRLHCGAAQARDLVTLARSLREAPTIKKALERIGRGVIGRLGQEMLTLAALADRIEATLVPDPPVTLREGGLFREGVDAELDRLRGVARGGKSWISQLRQSEAERTGIGSLKIGFNKVFGYYIEVSKPNLDRVPPDYERRQTLAHAERFVTPGLKEKEAEILGAEERIKALEYELFERLRADVQAETPTVQRLAAQLAEVDALAGLAEAALRGGYVRPEVDGSDLIEIRGGRHPVIETLMTDRPFVPNDVSLDARERQIWIVTGPNMAGKSTFIRQVALITLMAHMGSFVPARAARIGLVDRIFTRVGATDYLTRGQSTFLVEMTETANILNNATPRSLVILDEIGRGTSTYDGLSIAWAVVEHLHEKKARRARTLFATHYHELADLEGRLARVRNYNVAVREEGEAITFLYQVRPGASDHSYGIHAARLAGIPPETVHRAREILFELECSRRVGEVQQTAPPASEGPAGTPTIAAPPAAIAQPDLFGGAEQPILETLSRLDPRRLTPLQALQILDELCRLARGES